MNVLLFGSLAIVLYVAVALRTTTGMTVAGPGFSLRSLTGVLALLAIMAHAASLYPMTVTGHGFNLGIFSAASLVALIIASLAIVTTTRAPVASLAVVILPFAAVVIGLSLIFSNEHVIHGSPGLALHIALSLVAYSLFAIATVQAIYLAVAEQRLRNHTPLFGFLPPLPVMETLLFQLTGVAFVLLSLGLLVGAVYVQDIHAQHLSHKIVFSALAWMTFAALLAGRHLHHWRGRRAVKYVIVGFVFLALGYFGSKVALELILGRT